MSTNVISFCIELFIFKLLAYYLIVCVIFIEVIIRNRDKNFVVTILRTNIILTIYGDIVWCYVFFDISRKDK